MRIAILLVLLLVASSATASRPASEERDAALAVLRASADQEGRFDAQLVPYVVEAAAAAGLDLHAWPSKDVPLSSQVNVQSGGPLIGWVRAAYAAALVGQSDGAAGLVLPTFDGQQFGDSGLLLDDVFAIATLDVAKAGKSQRQSALDWLRVHQNSDGGWPWHISGQSDVDATGMVLWVAGAQLGDPADAAKAFLASARNPDGGAGQAIGAKSNCDSTVWAMRGAAAVGSAFEGWDYIASLGGARGYSYQPGGVTNLLCTAEVATALGLGVRGDVPLDGFPAPLGGHKSPGLSFALVAGFVLPICLLARRRL